MADLNKIISVQVDDKATGNLNKIDKGITKVTQSTSNLNKETKGSTQALLENGGAMGLLNDLTGGLAMTFKDASEAIGLAGVSLNSFKGIMIATGIGALVVAVGALAANWEAVSDALGGVTAAQKAYNEEREKQDKQLITDFTKINAALKTFQQTVQLNGAESAKTLAAFQELVKIIPELSKFDIARPEDLQTIQLITKEFFNVAKQQGEIEAQLTRIDTARQEFIKDYGKENANILSLTASELEKRIQLNENNNTQTNRQKFLNRDILNDALDISYAEQRLVALKSEQLNSQTKINNLVGAKVKLTEAEKKAEEEKAKTIQQRQLEEEKRVAALLKFNEDYYKRLQDLDADTEMKKINLQEKRAILELSSLEGSEEDKLRVYEYYERLRIELRSKYRKQAEQEDAKQTEAFTQGLVKQWEDYQQNQFKIAETDRLTKDAQLEQWMMYWDNVYSITQTAQDLLSVLQNDQLIRAQGLRDALLISEKGLAIAGVWINEAQSTAMATASANAVPTTTNIPGPYGPITIPNPMKPVAMAGAVKAGVTNKINAGIATAAILAQTIAGLNKRGSGGGGSASGGVGNQAPQAQFNIVGSSQTNQLAATIGAQQNQPVNAYVVGTDVTTQQALDRNRITNATFL
jgi:hypothetical protein